MDEGKRKGKWHKAQGKREELMNRLTVKPIRWEAGRLGSEKWIGD